MTPNIGERLLELPVTPSDLVAAHGVPLPRDYSAFRNRRGAVPGINRRLLAKLVISSVAPLDFLMIVATAVSAFFLHYHDLAHNTVNLGNCVEIALTLGTIFVFCFANKGGYRISRLQSMSWQTLNILVTWLLALLTLGLLSIIYNLTDIYANYWTAFWLLSTPLLLVADHAAVKRAIARWFNDGSLARHIVIVGAGVEGQRLVRKLHSDNTKSVVVSGIFDDRRTRCPEAVEGVKVLGSTDDLLYFARYERVEEVIVALPLDAKDRLKVILEKLTAIPTDLRLSFYSVAEPFLAHNVSYVSNIPLLAVADRPLKQGRALSKWLEDKVVALVILGVCAPLLAMIAALIKLDSKGPVLFVQDRFGFNNNVIRILKFRTMYVDQGDRSGAERTVRNDPRVTRVGRILRSLSLDELPQLINVLRGDMSVVGPRAHAIAMKAGDRLYHDAVTRYPHRHRVKPGITGWAQVNGFRGEVDTLEKAEARVAHDLYYIAHWSIWLDLKVLLMTVGALASRADAY